MTTTRFIQHKVLGNSCLDGVYTVCLLTIIQFQLPFFGLFLFSKI